MIQMGKLIRQMRKQQGMTQERLGSGILSKSVLSRVENGAREPDVFALNALFHRMGASLEYFEIVVSSWEYEQLKQAAMELPLKTVVIAENDLIKDIRKTRGWSQEQLSENVCARETISNIENGRTPNHKKWKTLLEKLGETQERYFGYVETTEYAMYPMVEQYQNLKQGDRKAVLLEKIRKGLDKGLPVNRQFLESSEIMARGEEGLLEPGEELAALEKCLRYTMPEYDGMIYRIPHRQEVIILDRIVACMERVKRTEAAGILAAKVAKKNGKKVKNFWKRYSFLVEAMVKYNGVVYMLP